MTTNHPVGLNEKIKAVTSFEPPTTISSSSLQVLVAEYVVQKTSLR